MDRSLGIPGEAGWNATGVAPGGTKPQPIPGAAAKKETLMSYRFLLPNGRLSLLLVLIGTVTGLGRSLDPIQYTVRFPVPETHYLEVEASIPATGPQTEVMMAVWTPGSYLVREYSRNVEDFRARTPDGQILHFEKTRKNRWRIDNGTNPRFEIAYRIYARNLNVQGNWVDADFAMLNGAPTFMTLVGEDGRPHEVQLVLPDTWKKSITGLSAAPGGIPHRYLAADFDELADCPIYAGNAPIYEFQVGGKQHYLVNEGESSVWDGPASARDVARIVEEYLRMWGSLPYDRYVFFNLMVESGGGLEHRNSTWLNTSRWAYGNTEEPAPEPADPLAPLDRRPARVDWLDLVSHEYFHLWNVKRLRPIELGPFDYENEVYTRNLWVAEGFTSYYGNLAVRRAGLKSRESFLRSLSESITHLQRTPGRLVQPLEMSSYDAWIKQYRPDENSSNTMISYYTKGELIAFLLDTRIRQATGNHKCLDDVMKLAYERFSGTRGYTTDDFCRVASDIAGEDLDGWFRKKLESTEELDFSEALEWFGLRFKGPQQDKEHESPRPLIDTGLKTRADDGRLVVSEIRRGSAGEQAGINVGDEILAVNGYRVPTAQWPQRLESYAAEEKVTLLIARREQLRELAMELTPDPKPSWGLEVIPEISPEQQTHLRSWLLEK